MYILRKARVYKYLIDFNKHKRQSSIPVLAGIEDYTCRRKEVIHVESSYQIQVLQIKKMMGTITKEENEWLESALAAQNQTLDSWLQNNNYRY